MKDALGTLQFVEKSSIEANVDTRQVRFSVTDKSQFDLDKIKAALKTKNFNDAKVVSGPS